MIDYMKNGDMHVVTMNNDENVICLYYEIFLICFRN